MTTQARTGDGSTATPPLPHRLSASSTAIAATPAKRVFAPAASAAEEAENPAPTGMPWNRPEATLAQPSANNSRLASTVSLLRNARLRIEPQDSANRIKNNGNESGKIRLQSPNEKRGKLGLEMAKPS